MAVTMLTYPKNLEGSITILGDKGTVRVGGTAVNKIEKWEFQLLMRMIIKLSRQVGETTNVYGFGHKNYYEKYYRGFERKNKPVCNGDDGLRSLEILAAAYSSAKNKPYKFSLSR